MLHLPDNVFVAEMGERAIVLDLARDKYLALAGRTARLVLDVAEGAPPPIDPDIARAGAALVAKGLLTEVRARPSPLDRRPPHSPAATLWPSPPEGAAPRRPANAALFWSVQRDLTLAWLALRLWPFRAAVDWVARTRTAAPEADLQGLLDAYFASRPWFPVQPICRLDAVALCRHLRRHGCPASLVFGVKLEPFRAHCWVQLGDRVLNEPHEIVARFTPIMRA